MSLEIATTNIINSSHSAIADSVDTQTLLDKLDPIVASNGCIRSAQEIPKIIGIMKDVSTLINKCLLLNILQTTKAHSTLAKLMDEGGWNILNLWLSDAKRTGNGPLLIEIIQVLYKLPVTMSALKQGNMGKLVKQLSKHESPEVKKVAGDVLEKWMTIFRQGQAARSKTGSESSASLTSDGQTDDSKAKKVKKSKKEKELKSPVELQPPLGPLVPLGKPRDKLKRPRDLLLSGKNDKTGSEKKPKTVSPGPLSADDEMDKSQKGITESSIFMNALSSEAAKWHEKRLKKIRAAGTKTGLNKVSSGDAVEGKTKDTASPGDTNESMESCVDDQMETDSTEPSKSKKRVTWAPSDALVNVQYFEVDEEERVNRGQSFLDAAQHEKMMEREALSAGRVYDQMVEMMQWYKPLPCGEIISVVTKGCLSEQKKIQAERENKVLGQLFLSKSSVAPTPAEPDPEPDHTDTKPELIPLMQPGAVDVTPPPVFSLPSGAAPSPNTGSIPGNMMPPVHHIDRQLLPPPPQQGVNMYHGHPPINEPHPPHLPPPPGMELGIGRGEQREEWYGYPPPNIGRGFPPHYGDFRGGMRGRGGRGRGRGRGGQFQRFRNDTGNQSNICKHFITHGCRLGNACKFLHVSPEELTTNMHSTNNHS